MCETTITNCDPPATVRQQCCVKTTRKSSVSDTKYNQKMKSLSFNDFEKVFMEMSLRPCSHPFGEDWLTGLFVSVLSNRTAGIPCNEMKNNRNQRGYRSGNIFISVKALAGTYILLRAFFPALNHCTASKTVQLRESIHTLFRIHPARPPC